MNRRKSIALTVLTLILSTLIYILPPVTEISPLAGLILGTVLIAVMTVCVFKGGVTDVSGK